MDDIAGRIGGLLVPYGVKDNYDTIWDKGVFRDAVRSLKQGPFPMFYSHDIYGKIPVGAVTALVDDEDALRYEADVFASEAGVDMLRAINKRTVRHTSFTFATVDTYKRDGLWHFRKADLIEVSPVVWPGINETTCEIIAMPTDKESGVAVTDNSGTAALLAALVTAFAKE